MTEKFADMWNELSNGLDEIYKNNSRLSPRRLMQLYTNVYDICTTYYVDEVTPMKGNSKRNNGNIPTHAASVDGNCEKLYAKLVTYLENYVTSLFRYDFNGCHGIKLLETYNRIWQSFQCRSIDVNSVCAYLNCKNKNQISEGKPGIYEAYNLAIYTWKEKLFVHVADELTNTLLESILKEHDEAKISSNVINNVLKSYLEMGIVQDNDRLVIRVTNPINSVKLRPRSLVIFKNYFENKYFEQERLYYSQQAYHYLTHDNPVKYFKQVDNAGDCDNLTSSTLETLLKMCDEIFVKNERLNRALASMVENIHIQETNDDVFNTCKRVKEALKVLISIIEKNVTHKVHSEIANYVRGAEFNPSDYVNAYNAVHKRFTPFMTIKENHPIFQALDEAFKSFINRKDNDENGKATPRISEVLARHIDSLHQKSAKNLTEDEMDKAFTQVIFVFKYIEDKDEFQRYYSKFLAKRLINGSSANEDYESLMLQRLQNECGFEYTCKFQRMCTDITVSKELSQSFKNECIKENMDLNSIDISVMVLTNGFWPYYNYQICSVPPVLQNIIEKFNDFYNSRHSGRKLTFLQHLSRAEITCNAYNRKYRITASTSQMAVLLKFNDRLNYTLQELIESLEFKQDILLKVLQPLLSIDLITLNRTTCLDANTPLNTVVSLNHKFYSKKLKINLTKAVTRNVTRENQTDIQKTLEDDRRMIIQSAIVRVMKMRQTLSHTALMSEVIQQLSGRFKPNVQVTKKCIQTLIEKEYLARVEGDHDTYKYLS